MYDLLSGIRVIDFSSWLLVPSAAALLAEWGADVVKVEDLLAPDPARGLVIGGAGAGPVPDGLSPMAEFGNRGKRSIALDIRTDGGRELLHRLIRDADVFMTNVRPGAVRRLGVDADSLRLINPQLICLYATGYGRRGPWADRSAFDLAASWASGGAAYLMTRSDREDPAFQAGSFGDTSGALASAGAISAALVKRERTGVPSTIDIALQSIGLWLMGPQILMGALGASAPPFRHEAPPNPLVNAYRTADDRWVYFCLLQADRFWEEFCAHIGLDDFVADPRFADGAARAAHTAELAAIIADQIVRYPLAEWERRLDSFDGVWAAALSPEELVGHPQVVANGFLADASYPSGELPLASSPAQFDGVPIGTTTPAPAHGEHTDEVLLELGLTMDEIIAHKIAGAVL
jgi:crotonobetainyl-CoA:carnitine CoA-transferase CaiB-like acyl-CoA transferase